jgi:hypothetical protein
MSVYQMNNKGKKRPFPSNACGLMDKFILKETA